MSSESYHTKLGRVRKPRVHITYDVETGGAMEKKELPFTVGVLADLSGHPDAAHPLANFKARKFKPIDRDNFNEVMDKIGGSYKKTELVEDKNEPSGKKLVEKTVGICPRLALTEVRNTLQNDDTTKLSAVLEFRKLSDFDPESVVNQIPALKKLLETRSKLANLRSSMAGNDQLEDLLKKVIAETQTAPSQTAVTTQGKENN